MLTLKNGRVIGPGHPTYVIAELGINHNGSLDTAMRMVDAAVTAGADAVKIQMRTPELCVPPAQRDVMRDTPWGRITYLEYRKRVELSDADIRQLAAYAGVRGITFSASVWDLPSVIRAKYLLEHNPWIKVPSAKATDDSLIQAVCETETAVFVSTGMMDKEQLGVLRYAMIRYSRGFGGALFHCVGSYPAPSEDLHLPFLTQLVQPELRSRGFVTGYSGHEVGLAPTIAAVAIGANVIERHLTLDRSMWGTDQAASVEPQGFVKLVRDIRVVEQAIRPLDQKCILPCEQSALAKLRG